MLISCEKCSTTYVLDETLIPAAGAAVQCTRCSHVFTAFPPGASAAPLLDEEPTTTKRKAATSGIPQGRPANQTMVFGTGAAAEPPAPPAQRPANQTMVFGTGPAQPPPAAAKPNQTMVFGAQPVPAPPAQRPANQTMVFGTAAGQQQAAQPAAPSSAANQTLVFGASPVAPPAANAPVSFGTAAGQQAAAREPPPRAPPPAANQTLVFGTKPPSAQALNQTMAFGTPAGQQLATGASQPPAPAANQTLVFGASPQVPAKGPTATMVFGAQAVQPPPSGANRPVNQTMMFGKPPEITAPAATKTMAFGTPVAVPPKRPLPKVTAGGDDSDGDSEPRAESTVRVDLERMMREHGEGGEGSADDGESIEQRHDRTQRFAMSEEQPIEAAVVPGDGSESVQDRHNRTALFAMSTLQETTKPDAKSPTSTAPDLKGVREQSVSVDGAQTLPPDGYSTLPPNADIGSLMGLDPHADPPGVSTLMEPGDISMHGTIRNDGPISSTMPNLSPIGHDATNAAHRGGLRLELVSNSDLDSVGTLPERPMLQMDVPADGAAVEALAAQGRRRNVVAIIVVLLIVLVVGLAVAWQLFGKQLLSSSKVDPESQQTVVQALQHFQQEDLGVREADIVRLQTLVKTNATFTEGHAALVLGLTLQIDDLRAQHAALVNTHARLSSQHEALKSDPKKDAATQAVGRRINAVVDRAETLKARIQESWTQLDSALKVMEAAVAEGAPASQSQRARVFAAAQQGQVVDDSSPEHATDYWLRLAVPLAALNAPKQNPAELKVALAQVEAMKKDGFAELPRPHFVAARLYVALGDTEKALPELELAVARAPNFKAAVETKKALEEK
ncbi:MAG: zinc-ribbon domain-containing protein [Myxococcales bacterium]|nr:zinc-ribbon domain-containing protein [Myxococcales bacterium]